MIYRALEVIQIFLAGGRTEGRTKVFQEVLADLKNLNPLARSKPQKKKKVPHFAIIFPY